MLIWVNFLPKNLVYSDGYSLIRYEYRIELFDNFLIENIINDLLYTIGSEMSKKVAAVFLKKMLREFLVRMM